MLNKLHSAREHRLEKNMDGVVANGTGRSVSCISHFHRINCIISC